MRFPEFQGEWGESLLDSLGDFMGGGTPSSSNSNFWQGDIPWVSSSDVRDNDVFLINKTRYINQKAIENSATKLCPAPVLLIVSRVGVGKIAYSKESLCTSQDFTNMVNLKCNGLFLTYHLSCIMKLKAKETQGTSIKGITSAEIKSIKLHLPNINEQDKIAKFLTLIDERISTQNKIIEKLESLIKALNDKLFCSDKSTCPELRFPDFHEKWENTVIGDILEIGNGKDYKHLKKGDIPVYGTGGFMTSVDDYLYDGESVCIGRKGTIDKPFFHSGKFWTVDTLFYTHSFKNSLPKFCFYIFNQINWLKYNEASGVPSLSKSTIESINISVPSILEQEKTSSFLTSLSDKMQIERHMLAICQKQKTHLLNNLFI